MKDQKIGTCLCGIIKFEVDDDLSKNDACHCVNCRKWSGHFSAIADIPRTSLKIYNKDKITWYHSSDKVRRGFCSICGSSLFFDPLDQVKNNWIGVCLGAIDSPNKIKLRKHIFVSEKGEYYSISDNIPQHG